MEIFPADTVTTITTGFTDVVGDNIAPVLGVIALSVGVSFVLGLMFKRGVNKLRKA